MHGANVSLFCHGSHRVCTSRHDGTWPLCGHLLPTEILCHHEEKVLTYPRQLDPGLQVLLTQWCRHLLQCNYHSADNVIIQPFRLWNSGYTKLACADISINVISMAGSNLIVLVIPLLVISISYIFIVATILRIPSTEGKRKAFSTCSAHLTVVIVFFVTIFFCMLNPNLKAPHSTDNQDIIEALISLLYGVINLYSILSSIVWGIRIKLLWGTCWVGKTSLMEYELWFILYNSEFKLLWTQNSNREDYHEKTISQSVIQTKIF